MTRASTGRIAKAALVPAAALLAACERHSIPQDTLNPAGPVAEKQASLYWIVFWIAVGVFALVLTLFVIAVVRFRHRPGRGMPKQVHGHPVLELTWTVLPALILAGIAVPTVGTIFELANRAPAGSINVRVVGHQWWWEVEYPGFKVETANEIHIPVNRPIYVAITSNDVIHSFWIPRLAGKQDLEPGRTNHLTLEADEPGRYLGQCAEYCGLSHANMRLRVFAETQADFEAWAAEQARPAAAPPPGTLQILQSHGCGGCHALNGVEGFAPSTLGQSMIGPDLTHFGSRTTFAGSTFATTDVNLSNWLKNPPGVKPGADMPNLGLTPDEIQALVAYLRSLR